MKPFKLSGFNHLKKHHTSLNTKIMNYLTPFSYDIEILSIYETVMKFYNARVFKLEETVQFGSHRISKSLYMQYPTKTLLTYNNYKLYMQT